ncbi:MAG: STAS domain-containing protein [Fibrobacterota bacterium]
MELAVREQKGCKIIDIDGKIDRLRDSITLKSFVNTLLEEENYRIVLNLSKVSYMDSGALNVLVYCRNVIHRKDGILVIVEPNEYVFDVLKVVGIEKIIRIYKTEEEFLSGLD